MGDHVTIDMLRTQIDQIDDQLLDLILRRMRVTGGIAEVKALAAGTEFGFRAGREAEILRRVLARAGNEVSPAIVTQIWRALIGESLLRQGLADIALAPGAGADSVRLREIARCYFGFSAPVRLAGADGDVRAALIRAAETEGVIAIAPWPGANGNGQWWSMLIESRFADLRIAGGWPLFTSEGPEAAFVARAGLSPSGTDESWAVAFDEHHQAASAIAAAGLTGEEKARARAAVLLRFDGFVAEDDPRLARLARSGLTGARVIGVCALA